MHILFKFNKVFLFFPVWGKFKIYNFECHALITILLSTRNPVENTNLVSSKGERFNYIYFELILVG